MIKLELTEEELRLIQSALVFASCTEACMKDGDHIQTEMAYLSEQINETTKARPHDNIYLFDAKLAEDTQVFHLLEKFTNKKQRYE